MKASFNIGFGNFMTYSYPLATNASAHSRDNFFNRFWGNQPDGQKTIKSEAFCHCLSLALCQYMLHQTVMAFSA